MLLAVQSGSGLAEGGGDHAVAGPIDLLCAGLAVGVAEVLIMGLVDLYLLKPKTYVPEAHVYYCTWPCPLACPCSILSNQSLTLTHCSAQSLALSPACQSYTSLSVVSYYMEGM